MPYRIPDWTHVQMDALDEQMAATTRHKLGGVITDLDGVPVDGIDGQIAGFQVNVRASALNSRSCSVQITDPNHDLNLVGSSVYKSRMLKLWVTVYVVALDLTAQIPIFTGPFSGVQRTDNGVQATALGKARLALRAVRDTLTIPKNTRIDDICFEILVKWCAFNPASLHIPNIPEKHPAAITTVLNSRPLNVLRAVLSTVAYDDFWDGDGDWWTRQFPTTPIWEWSGGQDGTILSRIIRNEADSGWWNVVDAHGFHGLYATAAADPTSALSAQTLKVTNNLGDVALGWVPKVRKAPNTKDQKRLQQLADAELARGLDQGFNYQFDARPWWRAEEYDPTTVNWRGATAVFNLHDFGFSDAGPMTVGYHRVASLAGPRARFQ